MYLLPAAGGCCLAIGEIMFSCCSDSTGGDTFPALLLPALFGVHGINREGGGGGLKEGVEGVSGEKQIPVWL